MECNKDDAIKAKTLAEKKLAEKDYAGAKKFTLKAQNLYPGLDGISQMLTTLDVYISAENKVSGEVDWYGILGVNPNDDDETIKKNYRKLALMLHPDKNKSVGADGAFKLLSEAWSLLSDKAKRAAYNQKRNMRSMQPKGGPSQAPGVNGVHSFTKRTTSKPQSRASTTAAPPPPPPPTVHRNDTFWTICQRCKMHYEYLKVYLNHTLLCPNCHEPFMAKEMAPPVNLPKSAHTSARQRHPNSGNHPPASKPSSNPYNPGRSTAATQNSGGTNVNWGSFSRTNAPCNTDPSIASKAASVVQQVNDRLKREREEFYAGWPSKKRKADDDAQSSGVKIPYQMSTGNGINVYGFPSTNSKLNRTRELTPLESRNMLMHKAQTEIRKKLNEWESEEKLKEENETQSNFVSKNVDSSVDKTADEPERKALAMNVPDPDFHDFDLDRTENSFEDNQVWAAYDDDDGMPRFYAMIHKVLSRNPLKMKISWLNSKTTHEFGARDWLNHGFRKTCGEFRVGRHEINKSLNSFSQKINWTKGRGIILVLPKKGEVWALYRNWSPDWNENTPDDLLHKYDMVYVLDDYNEEQGVPVSFLVKFSGFRTVFHPHTDKNEVKLIPKEEMFRFSHQVPKYVLTGEEAHNSPKGCLELDPAATPLELIQEAAETDAHKVENGEEMKHMDREM